MRALEGPAGRQRWERQRGPLALRIGSVLAVLALWQVVGAMLPPIFISTPLRVTVALSRLTLDGSLAKAGRESFTNLAVGFAISAVIGIAVGLAMGRLPVLTAVLDPYFSVLYATPKIVLIPLVIVWLGLGTKAKISLITVSCTLPIIIATYQAVRYTSRDLHDVARSLNLSPWQEVIKVTLPQVVPHVVSGLRIAIASGIITMVNAELYLRLSGIGGLLQRQGSKFDTAATMGVLVVLALSGLALTGLLKMLEQRVAAWRNTAG